MSSQEGIGVFTEYEIEEALGFAGRELQNVLGTELKGKIEQILQKYFSRQLLFNLKALEQAKMPQVVLRVKTIHFILDAFARSYGTIKEYGNLLRSTGYKTGTSFGMDFIGFLLNEVKKIPVNVDVLIKTWTKYDSAADWGQLSATPLQNEKVSVHSSIVS